MPVFRVGELPKDTDRNGLSRFRSQLTDICRNSERVQPSFNLDPEARRLPRDMWRFHVPQALKDRAFALQWLDIDDSQHHPSVLSGTLPPESRMKMTIPHSLDPEVEYVLRAFDSGISCRKVRLAPGEEGPKISFVLDPLAGRYAGDENDLTLRYGTTSGDDTVWEVSEVIKGLGNATSRVYASLQANYTLLWWASRLSGYDWAKGDEDTLLRMSRVVGGQIREVNEDIVDTARDTCATLVPHDREFLSSLPLRNHDEAFEALWPTEREKDKEVLEQLHDRQLSLGDTVDTLLLKASKIDKALLTVETTDAPAHTKADMLSEALLQYDTALRALLGPGGDDILNAMSSDDEGDED